MVKEKVRTSWKQLNRKQGSTTRPTPVLVPFPAFLLLQERISTHAPWKARGLRSGSKMVQRRNKQKHIDKRDSQGRVLS